MRREHLNAMRTIGDLIRYWAGTTPDAPAIAAPNRRDMSYGELSTLTEGMAHQLAGAGFGPTSRLAVVHPGGAEMMTTVLGIVNCAIAVPMSAAVTASEFAVYIEAGQIDGVLADIRLDTAIREVAAERRLPVIDVRGGHDGDAAGTIALDLPTTVPPPGLSPVPDDIAFVFGTSGTTRAPKLVPLRHRHMVSRSESTAVLHELGANDRCWNQNRLFLCSGISNACTALYAGGCVAHPDDKDRFDLNAFFASLRTFRPTWYVASYNFNMSVCNALKAEPSRIAGHGLRFIRTTSGHLDPTVTAELERIFAVPVIEAYSSTESGRICGNPLPPRRRKPGTVGPATLHSEVAVVDDQGAPLANGESGEVVVRGSNVFDGYADNPAVNATAFFGDWYRTGDVGFFDDDGYLTLVGRIKEMINRGGQKIAPVEIDESLLDHPAVADAASCALLHPTLGEIVGAAVVLSPGARATEREILAYLCDRLAPYKWPRHVTFVERIPRGPSGKVLRHEVATVCAIRDLPSASAALSRRSFPSDATPTQTELATLWALLLPAAHFGLDDDFFAVGGDSLDATRLVLSVNDVFRVELNLEAVFSGTSSIRTMAARIDALKGHAATGRNPDLPLIMIDERLTGRGNGGPAAGDRSRRKGKSRASDTELLRLFVLDKNTGLRRMRPGSGFGSVEANSEGYRSPDIPRQPPPGVIRLAFLGDSLTFGSWRGDNSTTWPHHALQTLQRAHPGFAFDYLNAALPGNGIHHLRVQLRESIAQYHPDVVALVPGGSGNRAEWARKTVGYCGVHYVPSALARRSHWVGLIEKNIVICLRQARALSDLGKVTFTPDALRELSRAFESDLHDLVTECQTRGCLVVMLTRESKIQRSQTKVAQIWSAGSRLYYEPYMSMGAFLDVKDEFNRVHRDVAARTGATLVDLAGTVPPTAKYFEDTSHFTPEGNRLIGERVGRALSASPGFQALLQSRSRSGPTG